MTGGAFPTPLVSTEWLAAHQSDNNLRILDGSWYLPQAGRNSQLEYIAAHIPGALFCDLDLISDHSTALPHMLPPAEQFARDAGGLGVGDESRVVVYDSSGLNMSAARIWWMFRAFGHDQVSVLDGGLGKWRAEGRPLELGAVAVEPKVFSPRPPLEQVRSLDQMRDNLMTGREQVLDARSAGRFAGTEPEPRPGLRSGHIPGSRNLPFPQLVGPDGALLPAELLRAKFEGAGIDLNRPVTTTCGSGTTACALLLALHVLGVKSAALYDGSWSQWGAV
jgi:thiosulfate/3-mercaptopyruvate sulfurtransferase